MHPPERGRPKTIPKIEPPNHVGAGQSDHDDRRPCLPNETMFDGLERLQTILAQVAPAYCRQGHGRRHRQAADPNHDREDVQRAGDGDVIHRTVPIVRAGDRLSNQRKTLGSQVLSIAFSSRSVARRQSGAFALAQIAPFIGCIRISWRDDLGLAARSSGSRHDGTFS